MPEIIYIEKRVQTLPRTQAFLRRFSNPTVIFCDHYKEIFNRRNQNFRLQKERPAWIVAQKEGALVHPIPPQFGIGAKRSYYFSHLLNCPFDCGYCFLQGMYHSAHYVFFINFEEMQEQILEKRGGHFFSGYDGDSLALEHKTHFLQEFFPFFARHPDCLFEVRTKSGVSAPWLQQQPLENVVLAWSLSPEKVVEQVEKKTAPLQRRLALLKKAQQLGWKVGLRFDPILAQKNFYSVMRTFFQQVFREVVGKQVHSVSLGAFRLPRSFQKNMEKNMERPSLLAHSAPCTSELRYHQEDKWLSFCAEELQKYVPQEVVHRI